MHCGSVLDVSSHVDDILPPRSSLETIYVGRRSGLHTGNMELLRDETGKKKSTAAALSIATMREETFN